MITLTETDAAYLAGIIDGEGSIMAYLRPRGRWLPYIETKLVIANTDRRLIDWLEARFPDVAPARVHTHKIRDHQREKPVWYWQLHARQMEAVLRAALPFLVIKRTQALCALAIIETHENNGRRGIDPATRGFRWGLAGAIQGLNRTGVAR